MENLIKRLEILTEKEKELDDIIKCNKIINKVQEDIYHYIYDNIELKELRLNKVLKVTTLLAIKNKEQSMFKVLQIMKND